jgi:hypothetical protein
MTAALCFPDLRACASRLLSAEVVLLPDTTLQAEMWIRNIKLGESGSGMNISYTDLAAPGNFFGWHFVSGSGRNMFQIHCRYVLFEDKTRPV